MLFHLFEVNFVLGLPCPFNVRVLAKEWEINAANHVYDTVRPSGHPKMLVITWRDKGIVHDMNTSAARELIKSLD